MQEGTKNAKTTEILACLNSVPKSLTGMDLQQAYECFMAKETTKALRFPLNLFLLRDSINKRR